MTTFVKYHTDTNSIVHAIVLDHLYFDEFDLLVGWLIDWLIELLVGKLIDCPRIWPCGTQ